MADLRQALETVRLLDPRPRGRGFEKFLGQVFTQESIRHRLSYRPEGEEIRHVAHEHGSSIEPKFLISYGKAPLLDSLAPSIVSIVSTGVSGAAAVLVVFDADTTDPTLIEQQRVRARKVFDELPPGWKGFVAIAVPEIEYWIGLPGRVDRNAVVSQLSAIDWNNIASQNAEVAALADFLRGLD